MRIANNQLMHLPVYTQAGEFLGRVVQFSIDVEQHLVIEYTVAQFPYIQSVSMTHTIPRARVVLITDTKMVVEDNRVPVGKTNIISSALTNPAATLDA